MTPDKILMGSGMVLFIVMVLLLRVGTTSLALFTTYGILALVGVGMAVLSEKIRDRR